MLMTCLCDLRLGKPCVEILNLPFSVKVISESCQESRVNWHCGSPVEAYCWSWSFGVLFPADKLESQAGVEMFWKSHPECSAKKLCFFSICFVLLDSEQCLWDVFQEKMNRITFLWCRFFFFLFSFLMGDKQSTFLICEDIRRLLLYWHQQLGRLKTKFISLG